MGKKFSIYIKKIFETHLNIHRIDNFKPKTVLKTPKSKTRW